MKKQNIFIIAVAVIATLLAILTVIINQNKSKGKSKTEQITPSVVQKVVIPTQYNAPDVSETGAKIVKRPDDEYNKDWLSYDLRNKCPIKNDYFEIAYNYKTDIFEVKILKDDGKNFEKWLQDTGYNGIPKKEFKIAK